MTNNALTNSFLVAILITTPCSVLASPIFGFNLISNGDAEAGTGSSDGSSVPSIPNWTTFGNFTVVQYGAPDFPSISGPGPLDRGNNFFAGGPSNASSSATQHIDVSSGAVSIDTGKVTFDLSGFFGGFSSQQDNAILTATFLDSSNLIINTASIGAVSNVDRGNITGLLFEHLNNFLPTGTRSIDLSLQMTRLQGSYNDGYADNLSLTLSPVPEPKTYVMLFAGLGLLGSMMRRNKLVQDVNRTKPITG
ncbi:MAG: PEP-CTERM sorting domain-containing protein [Proteobacteria bacterium]|nr:PEP-CTERM sorting domain-containing protein [Pseudomonadota bacterium]